MNATSTMDHGTDQYLIAEQDEAGQVPAWNLACVIEQIKQVLSEHHNRCL